MNEEAPMGATKEEREMPRKAEKLRTARLKALVEGASSLLPNWKDVLRSIVSEAVEHVTLLRQG